MSLYESDAYDAGSPKAPGYVDRLVDDADDLRTARKTEPDAD